MRKTLVVLLPGLFTLAILAGCGGPEDEMPDCSGVAAVCDTLGDLRCNTGVDGIDVCREDAEGCLQWVTSDGCGEHQVCTNGGDGPSCDCENDCTEVGSSFCRGDEIRVCQEDADGCFFEEGERNCGDTDQTCEEIEGTAQCSGCSTNRCPQRGQRRCDQARDVVELCTHQDDGCLDWEDDEDCRADTPSRICDEDGGNAGCVLPCEDGCDRAGDTRCTGAGNVEACVVQTDGCRDWEESDLCDGDFEYCDDRGDRANCVTCENECEAPETRQCHEDLIELCSADERGCLSWIVETDCTALEPAQDCYTIDAEPLCLATPPGDSCLGPLIVDEFPFVMNGENFIADFTDSVNLSGGEGCTARAEAPEAVYAVDLTEGQTILVRELGMFDAVLSLQAASCGGEAACVFSADSGEVGGHRYTATSDERVYVIVESSSAAPVMRDYEIHLDLVLDEVCDDTIDNDFDGDIDCEDSDCFGVAPCDEAEVNCTDGGDNDGDGAADCEDSDCAEALYCLPARGIYEYFESGDEVDIEGFSLSFTPDPAEHHGFDWLATSGTVEFPYEPGSGTTSEEIELGDDEAYEYAFAHLEGFEFYGSSYASVFISSNGYLTFDEAVITTSSDVEDFFDQPVVAGLRTDLDPGDPSTGGPSMITVDDWEARVVVTFQNVPRSYFGARPGPNDFQMVLNSDGSVELHFLSIDVQGAIVGIGGGPGDGSFPDETNFVPGEICDDEIDNDLDGDVDCADVDCLGNPVCAEICDDEEDNDFDGDTDCADDDCVGDDACLEICDDELDNDLDGDTDCADSDCVGDDACLEICDDDEDNDLDGDTDCADTDCVGTDACLEICDDELDNDLDGDTDCDDDDCVEFEACLEAICDDEIDNDDDGLTDCEDVDCARFLDCVVPLINEVGYDDASTDDREFVEIYTLVGDFDLSGYTLVHHNGSNGNVIWQINLAEISTDDDGFFVIGSTNVEGAHAHWGDYGVANTNAIQNDGESIVLYEGWDGSTGTVVDAVAWESAAVLYPEGDPAAGIGNGNWQNSIGRYPDGADTDENSVDFPASWWATPGTPNTPGQPAGFNRLTGSSEGEDSLPADIPDNDAEGITLTIDAGDGFGASISDIHVGVRIQHEARADLIVTITSPEETVVTLHSRGGGEAADLMTVYDLATDPAEGTMDDFLEEDARGLWTLNVSDHAAGDTGQVLEWVIWVDPEDLPVE
jgi:subtilisin-like proprotein convertase family protein